MSTIQGVCMAFTSQSVWVALLQLWLQFNIFQLKVGFRPGTLTVVREAAKNILRGSMTKLLGEGVYSRKSSNLGGSRPKSSIFRGVLTITCRI